MISWKILPVVVLGTTLITCGNSPAQGSSLKYGTTSTDGTASLSDLIDGLSNFFTWLNGSVTTGESVTIVTDNNPIEDIFSGDSNSHYTGTLVITSPDHYFDFLESDQEGDSHNNIVLNVFNINVYNNPNTETEPDTVTVFEPDSNDETPVDVQSVPEPLTILGAGVAVGFGILFKRELSKKKKKCA
ncbi:PEP-CTERM sorting domain-containing protein [Crocosphaera chwakensis]|uniref:PEP-CTERM protein-sorting domain-containing protein n=1 Tax=Crocosphaera chwakensis CCY0110 TaxID=391612 RepID=A3IYE1_9CHRO|nr:PEP-CTERM sorting domain-containing protein [Crocosphaera chwakensis]EAZ88513.1 hypothetical protein CY0110_06974 [Crocosphaera chwakensis CCY0110]